MIILNTITLLLMAHLLVQIIFKPKRDVLACGLFARLSNEKEWNELSRFKFQLLGVEMDSRGGDGCGIAFDGVVIKGANPKKFDDFWRLDNVPETLDHNAIIGHDRKASVGAQTLENTQPICFSDLSTILAHNGTVYNYKEMYAAHRIKDHYDYDITGMSDSQVIGLLMERSGWQVLNEYVGTMAFLYMRDTEPGVVYAYHGKSKLRKFASLDSEERPLYYAQEDGETWLCSTKEALHKIIKNKDLVIELPFNKVMRFDGNTMSIAHTVNRDKCTQVEDVTTNAYEYDRDEYNDYYYDKWKNKKTETFTPALKSRIEDDIFASKKVDSLYWEAGIFKINGESAHGMISVSSTGCVIEAGAIAYNFYFYNGNLLKGEPSYLDLLRTIDSNGYDKLSPQYRLWLLGKYFAFPFFVELSGKQDSGYLYSNKTDTKLCTNPFSGTIEIPFSAKIVKIAAGKLYGVAFETYRGIGGLLVNQVNNPNITEVNKLIDKITDAHIEEPEEDPTIDDIYACPICLGYGTMTGNNSTQFECEACNGDTIITKRNLLEYISTHYVIQDVLDGLVDDYDEERVIQMVSKSIDRAIAILDIAGFFTSEDLTIKLNEIKMMLWQK